MADETISLATSLLHSDDELADKHVAPAISVSTTFRSTEDEDIVAAFKARVIPPDMHVYSRYTQPVSTRVEKVLSVLHEGHALTYASGLAAFYAAIIYLKPKRIACTQSYMGCHTAIEIYKKSRDVDVPIIDLDDDYREGDLAWVETPQNPTGEAKDMKHYADKIHAVGGKLLVDSTFAPPPLQYPFRWGADIVFHSATKYLGGHSDLLSGVLVTKSYEEFYELWNNRAYLGNMMGSFESWLLLRSLRTLHLRVPRQSQSATYLAAWLNQFPSAPTGQILDGVPGGLITHVFHSSLQDKTKFDPATQLTGGHGATFAIKLANRAQAKAFPFRLKYWTAATSLGGVESLVEYRGRLDANADQYLIRLSVGVEDVKDLQDDLRRGLQAVATFQE